MSTDNETLRDAIAQAMPDHQYGVNPRSRWDDADDILAMPEMQAIRNVLTGLPDSEWHTLPDSVQDWAFGGTVRRTTPVDCTEAPE